MTDVSFDQTRNRTLHQHMSHESKFKGSVGLTNTGAGVAVRARNEGYPKVRYTAIRQFANQTNCPL